MSTRLVCSPSSLSRSPSLLHHSPLGRASKRGDDTGEEGGGKIRDERQQGEIEGGGGEKEEDSEMSGESFQNLFFFK